MFKNLKIGAKLGIGFGLILSMFAAMGIYAVVHIQEINNTIEAVVKDRMVKVRQTSELVDNTNIVARGIRNILLLQDSAKSKQEMERIDRCTAANSKLFDSLEATITSEEGKKILAKTTEARKAYAESRTEMFKLIEQGRKQEAIALLFGRLRETQAAFIQTNDDLITFQQNMAVKDGEAAGNAAKTLERILIGVILAAILASIAIAWTLTSNITKPIAVCSSHLDRIARGEIPDKVEEKYSGELETIRTSLNNCVQGLQGLVEAEEVLQRMAVNNYTTEVKGTYHGIFARVGEATNLAQSRTTNAIRVINNIAIGNFAKDLVDLKAVGKRSEQDTLMPAYILAMESIQALVADAELLSRAAVEGRLATRADASKHQGDFRKIIQGVNDCLDAVIGPVNEAAAVLEKVAARDMTARVMGDYQGDHAKIKDALNTAVDNLEKALSQVADSTGQVSSASQQIASGSQNLAQGANEQASSLEEVSASLEEMASMTRQNADNALAAKNLAGDADGDTKQGLAAMNRMSTAIGKIKESSDQTAKIVKTIDEIAMQTNLLALNAAVEAARAGEAGRGFAVVAEEVRNLAQRSAQAAKNTADMIAESVRNADDGVGIVTSVAQSLDKIAGGVKKVNDLIGEIAAASKEQSQGIKEVTEAVAQMDKVTQQNAANAEESASASEELSSQAEELQSMVAQFRIRGTGQVIAAGQPLPGRRPAQIAHVPAKNGKHDKPGVHLVPASHVIPLDNEVLKEF